MAAERFLSVTFLSDETVGDKNHAAGSTTSLPESIARGLGRAVTINGVGAAVLHNTASQQAAGQSLVSGDRIPSWVIAHRAGSLVAPENTAAAVYAAIAAGCVNIDLDYRKTVSGAGVSLHDSTVDAVTSSTGSVASLTLAEAKALTVDCSSWLGIGYLDTSLLSLTEAVQIAARFRDVTFWIEAKDSVAALVAGLLAAGAKPGQWIIQSFTAAQLVDATAAGFRALHLTSSFDGTAIATAVAAGATYIGTSVEPDAATVTAAHAAGLTVCCYIHNRRHKRDTLRAAGVDYIWTDDPVYIGGTAAMSTRTAYSAGQWPPGMHGSQSEANSVGITSRGVLTDGYWGIATGTSGTFHGCLQGALCPVDGGEERDFSIAVPVIFDSVTASDRWASVFLCAPNDAIWANTNSSPTGYHILVRQNGTVAIYRKDNGVTATSIASQSGASLTLGTAYTLTITVTPTGLSAVCNGVTATATDATYAGGYVHFGRDGCAVRFGQAVVS